MMKNRVSYHTDNSTNVRKYTFTPRITHAVLKILWLVCPKIMDRLIVRLFFSPRAYPVHRRDKKLHDQAEPFFFNLRQKEIRGWKWGKGPAVVFVHGWSGCGFQFLRFVEPLVRNGFSVITFDLPAHGESQGKTTNYFEITDTIRQLWNTVGAENIYAFAGHSMGAAALLNFVHKENFKGKIILISPPLKLKELLFKTFDRYGIPKIIYQNLIQDMELYYNYNLYYDNPAYLIKNLNHTIDIIHDLNDRTIPYSDSAHCARELKYINLHTTVGLGHNGILQNRSVINTLLQILLKTESVQKGVSKAS